MNCSKAKYVMPLYFSNELDVTLMAEFELHLEQCAACAREVEQVSLYDDLVRDAVVAQPLDTKALRARIRNQISTSEYKRRVLFRHPFYLMSVAALLLVAIGAGIIYFALPYFSSETVYASAADDHFVEVVQRTPVKGWRLTTVEIEELVKPWVGNLDILKRLTPADFKLARARVCDLLGEQYLHLVYEDEADEISVFVRPSGRKLPGAALETVNGCALHSASAGGFEISGFQTERFTVLIVSNLPRAENIRLARESALRVT